MDGNETFSSLDLHKDCWAKREVRFEKCLTGKNNVGKAASKGGQIQGKMCRKFRTGLCVRGSLHQSYEGSL